LGSKQQENLAKYSYDLSKIIVAILVITPLARPGKMSGWALLFASIAAVAFLLCGLFLDKDK